MMLKYFLFDQYSYPTVSDSLRLSRNVYLFTKLSERKHGKGSTIRSDRAVHIGKQRFSLVKSKPAVISVELCG